jgi:hypothetical protein
MPIYFWLNRQYNALTLPIGLHGFLNRFHFICLNISLYVSLRLFSSSGCFLNVCLHELICHFFDFSNACVMLADHNSSGSVTKFFLTLFAYTLEFLLNSSKGDGMSDRRLVKLFIIVVECCLIAHFPVIVICLWLRFLSRLLQLHPSKCLQRKLCIEFVVVITTVVTVISIFANTTENFTSTKQFFPSYKVILLL